MIPMLTIPIESAARMVAGGKRYRMSEAVRLFFRLFRTCVWIQKDGEPVITFPTRREKQRNIFSEGGPFHMWIK